MEKKCPNCGFIDSENYCSKCGSELDSKKSAFLNFIDSLLQISKFKRYFIMLYSILISPKNNLIKLYEEGDSKKCFEYLGISASIWFLIGLSKIWIIEEKDFISSTIYLLQFVITLTISIPIFYKLAVNKSPNDRSLHEFLVLSSLYIGTNILLVGIATFFMIVSPVFGLVLYYLLIIPIAIFTFKFLKYFWDLSYWKLILYGIISSFVGGAVGIIFLLICARIFNIDIYDFQ
ncbi:MAG: hypothetical protein GQ564_11175 [Bacteroidales bacterium]|nr:hypothetical protein [Bacteroidales bacterium]